MANFLLQENGDFLLQENGDKLILDEHIVLETANGYATNDTTPVLEFTGYDAGSDPLNYEIQIDTKTLVDGIDRKRTRLNSSHW